MASSAVDKFAFVFLMARKNNCSVLNGQIQSACVMRAAAGAANVRREHTVIPNGAARASNCPVGACYAQCSMLHQRFVPKRMHAAALTNFAHTLTQRKSCCGSPEQTHERFSLSADKGHLDTRTALRERK